MGLLIAVAAIAVCEGHILMVQRGRGVGIGTWAPPGGKLEAGETLEEAVERELLEETGVTARATSPAGWVEVHNGVNRYLIIDYFVELDDATIQGNVPVAGDDAKDARWFAVESVEDLVLADGVQGLFREIHIISRPS
ncbi:MAG: NUDIX domain-containing protein [Acidimicrobiaceae bacterium]|nr:NUDIX domain-containing protein [Acidimicrobiaceae bacterium]